MVLSIISFTQTGYALSHRIAMALDDQFEHIGIYTKCSRLHDKNDYIGESVGNWTSAAMGKKHCLVFVGACGIAVRAISHAVDNKLTDSPVIVVDEQGKFVIPILSGHVGRANEIAGMIARKLGAEAVITTATDLNNSPAVDVFAARNNLAIMNKEGIAKVSSKVLAGESITMSVDMSGITDKDILNSDFAAYADVVDYPPSEAVDIIISPSENAAKYRALLYLKPKQYVVGIGCRKNTPFEKIDLAICKSLRDLNLTKDDVIKLASIDVKKNETGILQWCSRNRTEYVTYTAEELLNVPGTYSASEFVKSHVGVDNVCERASVLGCMGYTGAAGRIIYRKHVFDSVTIAISKLYLKVNGE